jgi:hypothetical protein
MTADHNTESPPLVQAQIEEHKQLVPVYIKEPEASVIDSALVKWGSKIMMAVISMVILPIALAAGYHAYDKLENHGEVLAVVVQNQADMKLAVADISKKFDVVIGQIQENKNSIVALNQEVADMRNAPTPPPVVERAPNPVWHPQRRAPDPTPPFVRALEKAFDPRHRH